MIVLGVLASTVTEKFDLLSDTASQRALSAGVGELNVREALVWTNMKLSSIGWTSDAEVFAEIDSNLGSDYVWTAGPDASGGDLSFRSASIALGRNPSTTSSPGKWG
jgi:hypothetical protein